MEASTKDKKDQQASENGGGERNVGRIEEIQGVVIEAVFPDKLPEINSATAIDARCQMRSTGAGFGSVRISAHPHSISSGGAFQKM